MSISLILVGSSMSLVSTCWWNCWSTLFCWGLARPCGWPPHILQHQIKLFSEKQLFEGHLRVIMVPAAFILDCLLTITAVVGFLFNIYTLVSILFSKQVSTIQWESCRSFATYGLKLSLEAWILEFKNSNLIFKEII